MPVGSRGEAWKVFQESSNSIPDLFALTGTSVGCYRIDAIETTRKLANSGLFAPLDWGVVDWPGKEQRVALIFPKLPGTPLAQKRRYSDQDIVGTILPPMVAMLRAFAEAGFAHGGLGPATIYAGSSGELTAGECISAPPSALQPAWLQTIERGMASPFGRGAAQIEDDIYAVGATLASLSLGSLSIVELPDAEVIALKIERGSAGAITGRQQLSGGLGELIRGMLDDDPEQRWSLHTIQHWIAGRRTIGHQAWARQKPSRGLVVNGTEYFDVRSLAEAFSKYPADAMKLIANDELIKWVKRTLKDPALVSRIVNAVNMPILKSRSSTEALLIARITIAMHPAGPIRYLGLSVMPSGIGTQLQKAMAAGESPQSLAEVISCQLPKYWFNLQSALANDNLTQMKKLDQAKIYLDKAGSGLGLERCLYELAPSSPLLAQELTSKFIFESHALLQGLEALSERNDKPAFPLSRHVAAFLLARDTQNTRAFGRFIAARDPAEVALGSLHGLAGLQTRFGPEKLPGLARWLEVAVQPYIARFHNRDTREILRTDLQKAAGTGNLQAMLNLVENAAMMHRDKDGFFQATLEYERLEFQAKGLRDQLTPGALLHSEAGKDVGTIVAGILSTAIAAGILLLQWKGA